MHSLSEIIRMNEDLEVAKMVRRNRIFNSGETAKTAEKTGNAPAKREDWVTWAEWEAAQERKKKRKRRGY